MTPYEEVYEKFWKDIVENDDGELDRDAVLRELNDFYNLFHHTAAVYKEVTGGIIAEAGTPAPQVIDAYRTHVQRVSYTLVADYIENLMKDFRDPPTLLIQLLEDKNEYRRQVDELNSPPTGGNHQVD